MAKHQLNGETWRCLPGGAIEPNETPEQAAIRELYEECRVSGKVIYKTSEYADPYAGGCNFTFLVDIGNQEPALGQDPEVMGAPVLVGLDWLSLDEICERDRAFLWAAGLVAIEEFTNELLSWSNELHYPSKQIK